MILILFLLGTIGYADAQYYNGPPGPPPPPPPRYRERPQQRDEDLEMTPPSGYFEISIGLAQPVGSFSGNGGAGYSGYALPGDNISISLGIPINHSNLGIALMYSFCSNPFDLNTYVGDVQYADQSNTYYIPSQAGYGTYDESFIMGGLFATIPIQRLSFDFRLMGGVAICSLPEITYAAYATSNTANNDFAWDIASSSTAGLAFDMGGSIRYKLRRISIMAGIDFTGADPMVSTNKYYIDQFGNRSFTHVGGSLPISITSFSFGLGYEIR